MFEYCFYYFTAGWGANTRKWKLNLWCIILYSSFELQPKCIGLVIPTLLDYIINKDETLAIISYMIIVNKRLREVRNRLQQKPLNYESSTVHVCTVSLHSTQCTNHHKIIHFIHKCRCNLTLGINYVCLGIQMKNNHSIWQ